LISQTRQVHAELELVGADMRHSRFDADGLFPPFDAALVDRPPARETIDLDARIHHERAVRQKDAQRAAVGRASRGPVEAARSVEGPWQAAAMAELDTDSKVRLRTARRRTGLR
jgi:hypothetical protein